MKVFQINQTILMWFGLCAVSPGESSVRKIIFNSFGLLLLVLLCCGNFSCVVYVYKFAVTDTEGNLLVVYFNMELFNNATYLLKVLYLRYSQQPV